VEGKREEDHPSLPKAKKEGRGRVKKGGAFSLKNWLRSMPTAHGKKGRKGHSSDFHKKDVSFLEGKKKGEKGKKEGGREGGALLQPRGGGKDPDTNPSSDHVASLEERGGKEGGRKNPESLAEKRREVSIPRNRRRYSINRWGEGERE